MEPVSFNPNACHAEYHEQDFPAYRGNPVIETIPEPLPRATLVHAIATVPEYDPVYRLLPRERREDYLPILDTIRQPTSVHLIIAGRLRRLLLGGYLERNPVRSDFMRQIESRERRAFPVASDTEREIMIRVPWGKPTARGFSLLGLTGIGKTEAIKMGLKQFPQVILHTRYNGRPFRVAQVTYIHLQAAKGGSILTLCYNFFQALDDLLGTDYEDKMTRGRPKVDILMPRMARLAALHCLGLLVVDEIQELKGGGARPLISFLGRLTNEIGVPVVMVGGVDALPVLRDQFRLARRGATEGDMLLGQARQGAEFTKFVERLWRYQITRTETPLDSGLLEVLYRESQGITDAVVKSYKLAQLRAIAEGGDERIEARHIESAAQDSQIVGLSVMQALKDGNKALIRQLGDVEAEAEFEPMPFAQGDATVDVTPPQEAPAAEPIDPSMELPAQSPVVAQPPTTEDARHTARPTRAPRKPARQKQGWGKRPKRVDLPESLPAIVGAAAEADQSAYEALRASGVITDQLWAELSSGGDPAGRRTWSSRPAHDRQRRNGRG